MLLHASHLAICFSFDAGVLAKLSAVLLAYSRIRSPFYRWVVNASVASQLCIAGLCRRCWLALPKYDWGCGRSAQDKPCVTKKNRVSLGERCFSKGRLTLCCILCGGCPKIVGLSLCAWRAVSVCCCLSRSDIAGVSALCHSSTTPRSAVYEKTHRILIPSNTNERCKEERCPLYEQQQSQALIWARVVSLLDGSDSYPSVSWETWCLSMTPLP